MQETSQQAVQRLKKNIHPKLKGSPLEQIVDDFIDLMPRLNEEIHHINEGGCGIFAYLLWKRLQELGYSDIETVPIILTGAFQEWDLDRVQKNFEDVADGLADFEVPWTHLQIVLIDKANNIAIFLGSDKISVSPSTDISGHMNDIIHEIGNPISFDTLKKLLKAPGWSDTYDRSQTPLLKDILATLV